MNSSRVSISILCKCDEAAELVRQNRLQEAKDLYKEVLRLQSEIGFDKIAIAMTKQYYAQVLRMLNIQLDEAELLLKDALNVQEEHEKEQNISITLSDSNLTRDELAKVYEAKGNCPQALLTRVHGKRICGNSECRLIQYKDLSACNRCKCVFYCTRDCQRVDWKSRHRRLCQPITSK